MCGWQWWCQQKKTEKEKVIARQCFHRAQVKKVYQEGVGQKCQLLLSEIVTWRPLDLRNTEGADDPDLGIFSEFFG